MFKLAFFIGVGLLVGIAVTPRSVCSAEFVIYSVYQAIDLGNSGETPQKDFYVNMGTAHGIQEGSTLEVVRRVSTYDLQNEKFYRDLSFAIARLKVIHAEPVASIARLEKYLASDTTPSISPRSVMVGDSVRLVRPLQSQVRQN